MRSRSMVMPTPPPEGSSAPSVTAVTDVAEIGDDGAWLDRLIAMTSEREAVSGPLSVDTLLGIARPFSESAESKSPGSASLAIERLRLPAVAARQAGDDGTLDALAASLSAQGMLQPIIVRPCEDGFEVVAGSR